MKMRKMLVSIVALLLVVLVPVSAFAATHDVSDWDAFKGAVETDGDENVIINLLNDILGGNNMATTGENQK